jgi:hypothetical protein
LTNDRTDSYHFEEGLDPDPDPGHNKVMLDSDPHYSEKLDPEPN